MGYTRAREFFNMLETTGMSKSYKMPILKAFYNEGSMKMAISDEDVYRAMKEYYSHGSNGVDMLKDKGTAGYKEWGKKEYVKLAKENPIKFLKKTENAFFIEKEGYALALTDDMVKYIESECFCEHVKDIIELRTLGYYKDRFEKNEK